MAFIRTIDPAAATGLLREIYEAAVRRAGKVFQVIRLGSLRPEALEHSIRLYVELMRSERGALSRAQREMIATAVSRANRCHY